MTNSPRPAWRDAGGRFSFGNPGRPKGARNRVKRIRDLFRASLGEDAARYVAHIRDHHPEIFLRALIGLSDGEERVRVPAPPGRRPRRHRRPIP